ncbi:PREDICTED: protein archease-like [Branchiostoma belcheri]|uniref:Protein archease n=1 Tax=Branchiostoma belcheri TaxID=7741 RepID=A0A6P4XGL1_BRABE|nr:PREDICTED: protein archease-like [Branchiostoma belcheri]
MLKSSDSAVFDSIFKASQCLEASKGLRHTTGLDVEQREPEYSTHKPYSEDKSRLKMEEEEAEYDPEWEGGDYVCKYEYLDHTADVQLHSWGEDLKEAFEQCAVGMFGYMTEIETVEPLDTHEIEAEGDDMESLLYQFLDEWLFAFSAEPFFIARDVKIVEFDRENFKIKSVGYGETFDLSKHPQGTEVKAITYSAMQIHEEVETNDVYVVLDI